MRCAACPCTAVSARLGRAAACLRQQISYAWHARHHAEPAGYPDREVLPISARC
jgi:hypothetical protein